MATCKDCLFKCYTDDVDRVEETCNFFLPKDNYAEVVRCKDCKGWCTEEIAKHYGVDRYCTETMMPTNADDFCSMGERRTE